MHPFHNILVGLDLGPQGEALSTGSRLALREAINLARFNDARIRLIHSVAADEHWEADLEGYTYRESGLSEKGRAALQEAVAECSEAGLEVPLQLVEDKAWMGMIHAVQKHDHDLVVVGKRTEAVNESHLLGSVCHKLLRKCPCPVWAVKPDVDPIPKTVIAATDRSDCGDHALKMAAALALAWQSQLHVAVALSVPMAVQMSGERDAYEADQIETNRTELQKLCAEVGVAPDNLHHHIGIAAPTKAIIACVESHHADLLVMGSVGRSGIAGLLMGNTAERLLGRADCSLLVVKPQDFISPLAVG